MKLRPVSNRACRNPDCEFQGEFGQGNTTRHSFSKHKRGFCRRRRASMFDEAVAMMPQMLDT